MDNRLEMTPAPGAIGAAIDDAQASICKRLVEALQIPIYYGKP